MVIFPLRDVTAWNYGSCFRQNKHSVQSLQAYLIGRLTILPANVVSSCCKRDKCDKTILPIKSKHFRGALGIRHETNPCTWE